MDQKEEKSPAGFVVRDQRWWLRDDVDLDAIAGEPRPDKPHYVEELEQRLEDKDRQLREYIQAHKASLADMEGTRKRLEGEIERRLEVQRARLAEPFVEVLDNLERLHQACRSDAPAAELAQGIELVLRQLDDSLKKIGLERIPTSGQRFDPNTMEALMTEQVEKEREGMVVDELRPGYTLAGQLVRPAGVRVGVAE
ncbi:MAG: nucleotide exchange factor GrpE [Deltaproteobacteria bacterium]|nr:MAG: nucleotide exchange factor GrpE [Deltaproteobacteria bacterium]